MQRTRVLQAKLKCSIIKDLFSQIIKNAKTDNSIYLNFTQRGVQMVFVEKDKQVQIFVFLKRQMFTSYNFMSQNKQTFLYNIKDLQLTGIIFQNQSSIIQMTVQPLLTVFTLDNQFIGRICYRVEPLQIVHGIPEQVERFSTFLQNQPYTRVQFQRMKGLSNIIHILTLQKIQNLQLRFYSHQGKIQIVPLPQMIGDSPVQDPDQLYTIKVVYSTVQMLDHLRFNVRKFKTCLGLFDKNHKLKISFYKMCAKFQLQDQDRKNIQIILGCYADK